MVKVIQVDDEGTEVAAIEIDDFTVEVLYAGIGDMLRAAVAGPASPSSHEVSKQTRLRHQKILARVRT